MQASCSEGIINQALLDLIKLVSSHQMHERTTRPRIKILNELEDIDIISGEIERNIKQLRGHIMILMDFMNKVKL